MNFPSYKRGNRNLRKVNWLAQSRRTARHGRDMVGALNLPACLQLFPFLPLARWYWHCQCMCLHFLGKHEFLGVSHARHIWILPELGIENISEHLLTLSSNLFLLTSLRLSTGDLFHFGAFRLSFGQISWVSTMQGAEARDSTHDYHLCDVGQVTSLG